MNVQVEQRLSFIHVGEFVEALVEATLIELIFCQVIWIQLYWLLSSILIPHHERNTLPRPILHSPRQLHHNSIDPLLPPMHFLLAAHLTVKRHTMRCSKQDGSLHRCNVLLITHPFL